MAFGKLKKKSGILNSGFKFRVPDFLLCKIMILSMNSRKKRINFINRYENKRVCENYFLSFSDRLCITEECFKMSVFQKRQGKEKRSV